MDVAVETDVDYPPWSAEARQARSGADRHHHRAVARKHVGDHQAPSGEGPHGTQYLSSRAGHPP